MDKDLSSLKKHVFAELMDMAGRVYLLVRHSRSVVIGNRGFTDDEKENGIILVFNRRMKFQWDDEGISATLVFGALPQKCFVPAGDIVAVYSPELGVQFMTTPEELEEEELEPAETAAPQQSGEGREHKVITVDFTRKAKQ